MISSAVEGKCSEVMTWTSPKRFGNSSGPTARLPGCEVLWSVSPPSCEKKKKKPRRYSERVMIPCAWLPSPLGAITHDQARHHPEKAECVFFFSNLPPGGGCDLLLTCIRYSRGASLPRTTVFQVVNVCHVQVRWFIRCEVDDGSGENVQLSLVRRTVVSAQTDAGKKFRLIYCLFGLCCPPFIW